jgi:hypothetical protein
MPTSEPFLWLDDAQARHGGLRLIHSAVARGWMSGRTPELVKRRAALVRALARVIDDPRTPFRDIHTIARIFRAMGVVPRVMN